MAVVHVRKINHRKSMRMYFLASAVCAAITLGGIYITVAKPEKYPISFMLLWFFIGVLAVRAFQTARVHRRDLHAPQQEAVFLERLPDSFHIFTHVRLHGHCLYDAVVVGKDMIFVILNKDGETAQEGTSPMEQLKWVTTQMRGYMLAHGVDAQADGSLYCPDGDMPGDAEHCFTDEESLIEYIRADVRRRSFTPAEKKQAVSLIQKLV